MRFLLDTDACISVLRRRDSPIALRLSTVANSDIGLCSVVRAELMYGAFRASEILAEQARVRRFLAGFASLPFDDRAADLYGEIRVQLYRRGLPIGPNDLMIAAICLAHGLTLVTHNTREFSRI